MEPFETLEILYNMLMIIGVLFMIAVPTYLLNKIQTKKLTKLIEEESAIILHRINDLDNAIADLKKDLYEEEEDEDELL